jgi:hypothetical protein
MDKILILKNGNEIFVKFLFAKNETKSHFLVRKLNTKKFFI